MTPRVPGSSLRRREFLGAAAGLLLASSCSGGGSSSGASSGVHAGHLNAGVLSIDPYVSTTPQRLAFELSDDSGRFASGPPVTVELTSPQGAATTLPATLHAEGLPEGRGVYTVDASLPQPGAWKMEIHPRGHPVVSAAFEAGASAAVPTPGAAAPRAASPTRTHAMGVDPLCTRVPACPLHTTSLDQVIGTGRSVAVMFATPARCQSQYCGPVLDQLLAVKDDYADDIDLVHVEIYRNATSTALVPTVEAWNLPGEPWLFGIGPDGTITTRLDGAMGTREVRSLLDGLRS